VGTVAFRLAHHRPVPHTERIDHHPNGPLPLFVERNDYLTSADFLSAELLSHEGQSVVSLKLSPGGREKINHLASLNENAASLEDYVGLLRCDGGTLTNRLTIVLNPIPGYEIWLNHLPRNEAIDVVKSIGDANAS
jgi:hypothetical protein